MLTNGFVNQYIPKPFTILAENTIQSLSHFVLIHDNYNYTHRTDRLFRRIVGFHTLYLISITFEDKRLSEMQTTLKIYISSGNT